jgi:ectoine hydroxylase-related dioxygenase (phytanoyl-CoA dioxygenase family)
MFVKEGGADDKETSWHEDVSYQCMHGLNVVNFYLSLDPMPLATTLQFKRGSHRRAAGLCKPILHGPGGTGWQKSRHGQAVPSSMGPPPSTTILAPLVKLDVAR